MFSNCLHSIFLNNTFMDTCRRENITIPRLKSCIAHKEWKKISVYQICEWIDFFNKLRTVLVIYVLCKIWTVKQKVLNWNYKKKVEWHKIWSHQCSVLNGRIIVTYFTSFEYQLQFNIKNMQQWEAQLAVFE